MELDLFDFDLPADRIAQQPLADRSASRLLRLCRQTGRTEHRTVRDLPEILRQDDLLVFNDTAVVPAKLALRRAGGGRVGGLFLRQLEPVEPGELRWAALLNSKGRLRTGEALIAEADEDVSLTVDRKTPEGQWELIVRLAGQGSGQRVPAESAGQTQQTFAILARIGRTPLPPYIRRPTEQPDDRDRYQTVFATHPGAVAAPTAGLHFTPVLLDELTRRGIGQARVTLHVGLGTFEPVRESQIETHRMHSEWFECPAETAEAVNAARSAGRRVVAVGTTSVRVLESCVDRDSGRVRPGSGWTDIFIYPGYRFAAVDAMLTNFHLPRSTLLMLVCAFAGREIVLAAYRQAVCEGYRFFSYGDAMLIE